MQLNVDLGDRSYPVYIGSGIAAGFPEFFNERFPGRRCAVVTSSAIASIYPSYISALKEGLSCPVHELPDGEKYKTVPLWSAILDTLVEARLDRKGVVVALGGGVVGDMAGFAAACFMRGVDCVQVPTTLLAMVDSSVGGKTAVDHPLGKNLIGAFHQPAAVLIDIDFLKTLPAREFVAGYAEVFKYAFLGGRGMFDYMMANRGAVLHAVAKGTPEPLMECVERCVRIKAAIVGQDEREAGQRALLNFGHTFAHALEQFYGFEGLLHGEAVLWGICCAVELAKINGNLHGRHWPEFDELLFGLPLPPLPAPPDINKIYTAMFADKKAESGELRFILPVGPGAAEVVSGVGEKKVLQVLEKKLDLRLAE
ncbi:MAG: 3-dehydroquinate synthase [Chitinispirillia bacterium]|nr:3-dehydroquinate synthase [Chitinispirillia bacterium]MCL2269062.1 3-dehydroquinate synthase [Chitinispirillia bacterium]